MDIINPEIIHFQPSASFSALSDPLGMLLLLACKPSQTFPLYKPFFIHSLRSFKPSRQSERGRWTDAEREDEDGSVSRSHVGAGTALRC